MLEHQNGTNLLPSSEDRYRQIIETTSEGVWLIDADDSTTFVNRRMAEMLGYEPDEMVGKRFWDFMDAEQRTRSAERIGDGRAGQVGQIEGRLKRKHCSDLWTMMSTSELHDDEGNYVGALAMVSDISERKEAEHDLGVSRELLRAVLDGSPSLIFTKDRSFRYLLTNRRFEQSFNFEPGKAIGRTDESILSPKDVERVRAMDRHVLETGEPVEVEHVLPLVDGEHVFLTHKYPLRDEHGEVYAVCGVSTDITEHKQAQEELRRRRAERQTALSALGGQALAGTKLSDLFAEATITLSRLLDVEFTKVLELQPDGKVLVLRAATGLDSELVDVATFPATTVTQAGYTLRAEQPVIVENLAHETRFEGAALLQRHGVVSGMGARIEGEQGAFGVVSAHTSRRRRFTDEEANFLQAIANVLGWAITRDRAERLELQLQGSQRLESVGQLAGGIAHDFNNLLAVILNYASFAIDRLDTEDPIRADIEEVAKAAGRAADLTRQLLVFSRREPVTPDALNLNAVVGDTENMLRRTLGEHIELETKLEPALRDVMIDTGQLEQILLNLAVNSRDAMPEGGVLEVATENAALDTEAWQGGFAIPVGDYVRLSVSDTGVGMPKEVLEHAFDPFFTTKPKGHGTGLGLATVYGAVKQAGGYVNLYSEEGQGTVARVYLPVTDEARRRLAPSAHGPTVAGGGETVLLVEDEESVRKLTERILRQHGYEVIAAPDGEAAIRAYEELGQTLDLLLTDVVMPRMSGKELAERIRSLQPDVKVLYTSGYPNEVIARRGVVEGGVLLLEKPFSAPELLNKTRAALATSQGGSGA